MLVLSWKDDLVLAHGLAYGFMGGILFRRAAKQISTRMARIERLKGISFFVRLR
jgi:hypothetical protein